MKSAAVRAKARPSPPLKPPGPKPSHPLQLSLIGLLMLITLISIDLALFLIMPYLGIAALFCFLPAICRTTCITVERWLADHVVSGREIVELLLVSLFISGGGALLFMLLAYGILILGNSAWSLTDGNQNANRFMEYLTFTTAILVAGYVTTLWFQWTWPPAAAVAPAAKPTTRIADETHPLD